MKMQGIQRVKVFMCALHPQVTSNGISHVQWLPSRQHMVVAAGDKSGNLGVWNVDHQDPSEGNDGVYQFKPHYSYISGMRSASDQ